MNFRKEVLRVFVVCNKLSIRLRIACEPVRGSETVLYPTATLPFQAMKVIACTSINSRSHAMQGHPYLDIILSFCFLVGVAVLYQTGYLQHLGHTMLIPIILQQQTSLFTLNLTILYFKHNYCMNVHLKYYKCTYIRRVLCFCAKEPTSVSLNEFSTN